MAERRISGTAEEQLAHLQTAYGMEKAIDSWCRALADQAIPPTTGGSAFDFDDVLDKTGKVIQKPEDFLPSDEVELIHKAAKWGWDALNGLRNLIKSRTAGVSVKIDSRVFRMLSDECLRIEIVAIYEVDPKAGVVTFRYFEWFNPGSGPEQPSSPDEARQW